MRRYINRQINIYFLEEDLVNNFPYLLNILTGKVALAWGEKHSAF